MLKNFLKKISEGFKSIFYKQKIKHLTINQTKLREQDKTSSSGNDNILKSTDLQQEVKEQAWFSRTNNLVAEFAYTPTPVYSSDFSKPDIIGWLQSNGKITPNNTGIVKEYKGFMIIAENHTDLATKIDLIDAGTVERFHTIAQWKNIQANLNSEEELLADDVDLLKNDPNYAKPNLEDKKNIEYAIGIDPYSKFTPINLVKIIDNKDGSITAIYPDRAETIYSLNAKEIIERFENQLTDEQKKSIWNPNNSPLKDLPENKYVEIIDNKDGTFTYKVSKEALKDCPTDRDLLENEIDKTLTRYKRPESKEDCTDENHVINYIDEFIRYLKSLPTKKDSQKIYDRALTKYVHVDISKSGKAILHNYTTKSIMWLRQEELELWKEIALNYNLKDSDIASIGYISGRVGPTMDITNTSASPNYYQFWIKFN